MNSQRKIRRAATMHSDAEYAINRLGRVASVHEDTLIHGDLLVHFDERVEAAISEC